MRHMLMAIILFAAIAIVAIAKESNAQNRPWGAGYIPNLSVMTQDGKAVQFYDDLIKDKIVIISFIYTSCTDICPLTTARMAQLEEKLGESVGRDIFIISMTVDPVRDTPERLKDYAKTFRTGPGWSFVTGKLEDIRAINYKFGDRSQVLSEHRNEIVIGNEATGEWQRDTIFGDLNRLVMAVRALDPKWRDEVRAPDRHAANNNNVGVALSSKPGQALFKKMCAPCHTIGVGNRVGPDLRGVTNRRSRSWLTAYIQNPAQLRAKQDPVSLALAAEYPTVRMPALGIAPNDSADLIAYLGAETSRLTQSKDEPAQAHHNHRHHKH